jgi:hypothetical protein
MAEQVVMWKAEDGQLLQSESQCRAYELKRRIGMLGKQMDEIKFNQFGQIDVTAVNAAAAEISFQLVELTNLLQISIISEQAAPVQVTP